MAGSREGAAGHYSKRSITHDEQRRAIHAHTR